MINYVFRDISAGEGGSFTKILIKFAVWISERGGHPRYTQE